MNTPELRAETSARLRAAAASVAELTAFVGLDGFVDEILHVVDKRESATSFQRFLTIASFAERIAAAAGKSANIELVRQRTKLGGNGPIMANALATFGFKVTYLGALGYPRLHPVFDEFARRAEVHSINEPGVTDALEFEDGKLMLGKYAQFAEITWASLQQRFGRDRFAAHFGGAQLVGFVNWTMLPTMSDLWESLLQELCPALTGPRRKIFFDLADPAKRTRADIVRATELIARFSPYFDVILGLNEREAGALGEALGLAVPAPTPAGITALAVEIQRRLTIDTVVVHPTFYAVAAGRGQADLVEGPRISKIVITTGAGDHFNSGFCLAKLLGLGNAHALLTAGATSGFYVSTGRSPTVADLAGMIENWPV